MNRAPDLRGVRSPITIITIFMADSHIRHFVYSMLDEVSHGQTEYIQNLWSAWTRSSMVVWL